MYIILQANEWHNMIVVRDKNKNYVDVIINRTATIKLNFVNISNVDLSIPGTLRLGNTFAAPSLVAPLHGQIMCVQVTLAKLKPVDFSDLCYDYDAKCNNDRTMPTTSTTTKKTKTPFRTYCEQVTCQAAQTVYGQKR
ncbi:hypothetical protein DPMN_167921 [Dreissena polymorpha]|uniref:Uncharacterized protein n=1 Tax=Dreissena polymorpha TaxID=45954 RepID=A0A9D4F1Q6_DREPO|nr:hypothetical protein DPMN_167921 [Dreissena polymorpha]